MRYLTVFLVSVLLAGVCEAKPLKVFVLAGQSNMQGHAKVADVWDHWAGCGSHRIWSTGGDHVAD